MGGENIEVLRREADTQAAILTSVAIGGAKIDTVEREYQDRHRRLLAGFRDLGLTYEIPWRSLWEWHGAYKLSMPTYAERRAEVGRRMGEVHDALDTFERGVQIHDPDDGAADPTWDGLNARIRGLVDEYGTARDRDTWQDVGRRSREILIDLGKLIADPALVPDGEEPPKGADARKWFDLLVQQRASGADKKELRAMMRATWDLAQKVTHGDISAVDAFASAQATVLLVRTTQMLLELPAHASA